MTNHARNLKILMKTNEFDALSKLCKDYQDIFSMDASAAFNRLKSFYEKLEQTSYVQGLLMSGELEQAIAKLESEFAKTILISEFDLSRSSEEIKRLKEHKCLERRVRFIHRLAKLIGPSDITFAFIKPAEQNKLQKKVAKSLGQVQKDLRLLLKNEFFQESLSAKHHDILKCLNQGIENAVKFVAEIKPDYPIDRVRDKNNTRAKILINRLADVCFRIYGNCDETIINHLTSYPWLVFVTEIADIDALIKQALERKTDLFERRINNEDSELVRSFSCRRPNEDSESVELDGEWSPAQTIDPPWMEA
jgi:hypothetical protein